jgi:hypothetical protein
VRSFGFVSVVVPVLWVGACSTSKQPVQHTVDAGVTSTVRARDASVSSKPTLDAASNPDAGSGTTTGPVTSHANGGHTGGAGTSVTSGTPVASGTAGADSSAGAGLGTQVANTSVPPDGSSLSEDSSAPGTSSSTAVDAGVDAGQAAAGCEPNALQCQGNSPEVCDADRIWRPLLACEAPLRCSAGQCVPALENECPLIPTLPRFTGTQVVDGDGADFNGVPAVNYALRDAPGGSGTYDANLATEVSVRMAWTPSALVAHVRVTDPAVQTYSGETLEYYWQGDNVQFFIAPTDLLTGKYSGKEDSGATHLVIVPPAGGQPSRAIEVYEPCYACVSATPSNVAYVARTTLDGYEVEIAWPWAAAQGPLVAGGRVSLNLIVGASDTPGAGLELEGRLANNAVMGETPCGGETHPGCDDRTWCFSTLE